MLVARGPPRVFALPPTPVHTMALFGKKKTTIGLDIGSGLIKVAVIDHGDFDQSRSNVETHGCFLSTQESHEEA